MPWTKEQRDKFYREHRESILQKKKQNYWIDPDKFRTRAKRNYPKYKKRINAHRRTPEYREKMRSERWRWKSSHRKCWLKTKYGMSIQDFENLVKSQNGKCAICGGTHDKLSRWGTLEKYLHVDHCHKTKKVRGLLCHRCNVGLAMFDDDTHRMRVAIGYLESVIAV